jgi:predicted metal-dependent phosphoesterase TrpH
MYKSTSITEQKAVYTGLSKADLHLHTEHSDGSASVEALLEHVATKTDLRVIAITDHDTIEGALKAQRLAASFGVEVIVGEEVSTRDGHLLALFIERDLVAGQSAAKTIAEIHAQGGLAIAAHPYDWMVSSMGRRGLRQRSMPPVAEWPLDGIEAFNAGVLLPTMNARASVVASALGLAQVGGSDSHHLATVGYGYTRFPGRSAAELRRAIVQRQVQAAGHTWGWRATLEATAHVMMRLLGKTFVRAISFPFPATVSRRGDSLFALSSQSLHSLPLNSGGGTEMLENAGSEKKEKFR